VHLVGIYILEYHQAWLTKIYKGKYNNTESGFSFKTCGYLMYNCLNITSIYVLYVLPPNKKMSLFIKMSVEAEFKNSYIKSCIKIFLT